MLDSLLEALRGDFMPHGHCYLWQTDLLWLHAGSDALTAFAYSLIPFLLIYFVVKRKDLAFRWMFVLFGAFILSCGTVHALEVWSIWNGAYYITGSAKLITGVVSMTTAVLLIPMVPKALALPSPSQLQASEARYRSVVASLAEGVLVADVRGTVMTCNASAAAILGISQKDITGASIYGIAAEVVDASGQALSYEMLPSQRVLRTGEPVRNVLVGLPRPGQAPRWLSVNAQPLPLEDDDRGPGVVVSFTDVTDMRESQEALRELNEELEARVEARTEELQAKTERLEREIQERKQIEAKLKTAKQQAEAANRAKSTFLASMSHEIRTPLTGIIGYASLLEENVTGPEREFAEIIGRGGRQLMDMLSSVLTLARLESKTEAMDFDTVDVGATVGDVAELHVPKAEEKKVALQTTIPDDPVYVRADPGALNRVLQNLVSNAVKFTDEGRIAVRVEADVDAVRMVVEDTGIGIAESFLDDLFEEFQQESTGFARSHEGSGLGLALTQRLVEQMHGTIDVGSTKGEGTVFTVTLPRAASPTAEPPALDEADLSVLGESRLLVVEDNDDTRALLIASLQTAGQVQAVATADAARTFLDSTTFDAILLDIHLGDEETGLDLIREIRAHPQHADVPVVAITAYALPGDEETFLESGFDAYISKPFVPEDLLRTVATHLRSATA